MFIFVGFCRSATPRPNDSNPNSDNRPHNREPSEKLANSTTNEFSRRRGVTKCGEIARALRRIHLDFPRIVDVGSLASEAGMSIRLSRQLQGRYSHELTIRKLSSCYALAWRFTPGSAPSADFL
jgi:hypothetical protein